MRGGAVLAACALEKGRGGGHLVRSALLVQALRSRGREACLYLEAASSEAIQNFQGFEDSWLLHKKEEIENRDWAFIVLDNFQTPPGEAAYWLALAPVIAIDEGGPLRDSFDFLLDLLPGLTRKAGPNLFAPRLLPLPSKRRPSFEPASASGSGPDPFRILVSFGAEDPAGLTSITALSLLEGLEKTKSLSVNSIYPQKDSHVEPSVRGTVARRKTQDLQDSHGSPCPCASVRNYLRISSKLEENLSHRTFSSRHIEVTALFGALHRGLREDIERLAAAGVHVLGNRENLREELAGYDLLVTHFGLTAFEALHARLPVLIISPTAYHDLLARNAGFVSAGTGHYAASRLGSFWGLRGSSPEGLSQRSLESLSKTCAEISRRFGLEDNQKEDFGSFIAGLYIEAPPACPLCGAKNRQSHRVLARFHDRTYRLCPSCGMVYMLRSVPPPIEYGEDYFFASYKKQYGKTYLEDFPYLKEAGKRRLARMKKLLPRGSTGEKRLLDIGCAYGPFLAAAREEGFSPFGQDPASGAVDYVNKTLGIPAFQGYFPGSQPELLQDESFDAVSLWYVIEHFRETAPALEKIRRILKPGGVLAFSTPSFSGISGRVSRRGFLGKSPGDHWTIWTPALCKKALGIFGFRVKKIVCTGHHPERFPLFGKRLAGKKGPAYSFFYGLSLLFGLGDTFEVYAVKE